MISGAFGCQWCDLAHHRARNAPLSRRGSAAHSRPLPAGLWTTCRPSTSWLGKARGARRTLHSGRHDRPRPAHARRAAARRARRRFCRSGGSAARRVSARHRRLRHDGRPVARLVAPGVRRLTGRGDRARRAAGARRAVRQPAKRGAGAPTDVARGRDDRHRRHPRYVRGTHLVRTGVVAQPARSGCGRGLGAARARDSGRDGRNHRPGGSPARRRPRSRHPAVPRRPFGVHARRATCGTPWPWPISRSQQ